MLHIFAEGHYNYSVKYTDENNNDVLNTNNMIVHTVGVGDSSKRKNAIRIDKDGSVYLIVGDYIDYKVLLFKFSDFKELKLVNNNVYGISKDTIYMYNTSVGLRKVASYRELNYNHKNMYDVYYS